MELHVVAEGDPSLNPIVERTRFACCVEPQATNCPRAGACAGFAASILLPLAFCGAPKAYRAGSVRSRVVAKTRGRTRTQLAGSTLSTKTHTYAAGNNGESSSLASSAVSRAESSRLGRLLPRSGGDAASRGPNLDRTASSTSSDVKSNCRASSSKPPAAKRAAPTDRGPRGARSARWSATCA